MRKSEKNNAPSCNEHVKRLMCYCSFIIWCQAKTSNLLLGSFLVKLDSMTWKTNLISHWVPTCHLLQHNRYSLLQIKSFKLFKIAVNSCSFLVKLDPMTWKTNLISHWLQSDQSHLIVTAPKKPLYSSKAAICSRLQSIAVASWENWIQWPEKQISFLTENKVTHVIWYQIATRRL